MKKRLAAALCLALIAAIFGGCGCSSDVSSDKKSTVSETLSVIETTPDGGTVERDAEGNTVTKDKNGAIISVEDKNGEALEVEEYIDSHPYAVSGGSADSKQGGSGGSDKNSSSASSSKSSSKTSSNKSSSKSSSKSSTSSKSSSKSSSQAETEEEIPEVIATIPDDDKIEEIVF